MDHTVVHFEIPANDLGKLKAFYEKLFGWKISNTPMEGVEYWVIQTVPTDENGMLQRPGVNGGMFPKQPEQKDQRPVNYITVESIDEYIEKTNSLGGKVLMPKQLVPGVGYISVATDPEGNQFGLLEPMRK